VHDSLEVNEYLVKAKMGYVCVGLAICPLPASLSALRVKA